MKDMPRTITYVPGFKVQRSSTYDFERVVIHDPISARLVITDLPPCWASDELVTLISQRIDCNINFRCPTCGAVAQVLAATVKGFMHEDDCPISDDLFGERIRQEHRQHQWAGN